jgi:hypothetical protein
MHDMTSGIGGILIIFGLLIFIVGGFWFMVRAFTESVLWGLAVLFIPIVSIFFLIVHWENAKRPFFVQLFGFAILGLGVFLNRP